ncbi:hypothetical protein CYMTET_49162 [Cymbomonas tetramitiformis]|uniref:Reverse transcriptase RNase H-like domain-containing protein n=1 Tax=Cymbomonas tetramitiformis TaxID=36881 RepID=A0AAE0BRV2_9CHLO|nr:hypothetical protein CYMTET_49162 [Cymbomonas tetramitiformis]
MMAKRDPDSEESAFATTATDLPKSDPSQPPSDNQDADISPEWTLKFQAFLGENQRAYKKSAEELRQLRDRIEILMAKDHIRPSANPYAAPCLMIPKPGNPKELRLVIDHRMLNKQTVKDKYPLPDIQVMFDEMHGVKFFSSFDAVDGFWQRDLGHLSFVRIFIDDVVVFSNTLEEHHRHAEQLLLICREKGVFLKRSKVQLLKKSLRFLDHTISADGCRPASTTRRQWHRTGGVLMQDNGDGLRVIAYESRQFSAAEQNYHTGEREFCALHYCTTVTWRHYLTFTNFRLQGDHRPLEWLMEPGRKLSRRQARWYTLYEFS